MRRPRPQPKKLPMRLYTPYNYLVFLLINQSLEATSPPPSSSPVSENGPSSHQHPSPANEGNVADEELAAVKLPATTLQVWGSLLGRRGYEVSDGQLIRSPTKARMPLLAHPTEQLIEHPAGNGSLISQFRRSNSFAPARPDPPSNQPQPFRRTKTISALSRVAGSFRSALPEPEKVGESSTSGITTTVSNIFGGAKFIALGEAKSPSVREGIEVNGGRLISDADDEGVDFIIVRLVRCDSKFFTHEFCKLNHWAY